MIMINGETSIFGLHANSNLDHAQKPKVSLKSKVREYTIGKVRHLQELELNLQNIDIYKYGKQLAAVLDCTSAIKLGKT